MRCTGSSALPRIVSPESLAKLARTREGYVGDKLIDEPVSQEFSNTVHLSGQSRRSSRSTETVNQRNRRVKALRRGWDCRDGLNTQTLISFRHVQQWRRRMIHFCFLRFAARTWKKLRTPTYESFPPKALQK